MQSKKIPSPVSRDTDVDDNIEMESCVDLKDHQKGADMSPAKSFPNKMWGIIGRKVDEKEYPPPIPLLVRTENLGYSHMPWVMKRKYTADGRLILTEEKVRHCEFFRAHRSDGRLTLQLVAVEERNVEMGNVRGRDATLMLGVAVPAGSLRTVRG
ncbi:uncharacterized protein LOC120068390 [Benincasa hispida]|uniref:uncharacterized protein LOC120068390 n=1 Tax=Benincasa hispida TaxID=102211 RepID=UPI0019008367|nr:uncharacterized protein LOC120068390 [Benincasa hispida]